MGASESNACPRSPPPPPHAVSYPRTACWDMIESRYIFNDAVDDRDRSIERIAYQIDSIKLYTSASRRRRFISRTNHFFLYTPLSFALTVDLVNTKFYVIIYHDLNRNSNWANDADFCGHLTDRKKLVISSAGCVFHDCSLIGWKYRCSI